MTWVRYPLTDRSVSVRIPSENHNTDDEISSPGNNSVFSRFDTAGESVGQDDLELMSMSSAIGRKSGERDPLLLRCSIMSDETIKGLKQSVISQIEPILA